MFVKPILLAAALVAPVCAQLYACTIEVSDDRIVSHRGVEVRSGQSNTFNLANGPNIPDGERGFLQIAPERTFDCRLEGTINNGAKPLISLGANKLCDAGRDGLRVVCKDAC